jgi:hypothetical protein
MKNRQLLDTYGYKFWRQMAPIHLDFFMTYERWKDPMMSPRMAKDIALTKVGTDMSEMNGIEQFHIRRFMEKYEQTTKFMEWLKNE